LQRSKPFIDYKPVTAKSVPVTVPISGKKSWTQSKPYSHVAAYEGSRIDLSRTINCRQSSRPRCTRRPRGISSRGNFSSLPAARYSTGFRTLIRTRRCHSRRKSRSSSARTRPDFRKSRCGRRTVPPRHRTSFSRRMRSDWERSGAEFTRALSAWWD